MEQINIPEIKWVAYGKSDIKSENPICDAMILIDEEHGVYHAYYRTVHKGYGSLGHDINSLQDAKDWVNNLYQKTIIEALTQ